MSRISQLRGRLLTGIAALPVIAAGVVVVTTTAPAQAESCYYPAWSDVDPGSGYANVKDSTAIRTGPIGTSGVCGVETYVGKTVHLAYDCYVINRSDISWTHVHLYGSPGVDSGWVKDAYLGDFGAKTECPK